MLLSLDDRKNGDYSSEEAELLRDLRSLIACAIEKADTFARDYSDANEYAPYLYAGMLFNVSVKWLDDGCAAPEDEIARTIVDAIYP